MKEEIIEVKVPVRVYTKVDLALLYNPGVSCSTALQLLPLFPLLLVPCES